MKTVFSAVIFVILLFIFDKKEKQSVDELKIKRTPPIDSLYFNSKVLPILRKNCSPCHFTGGKMYVRMPFDQPATLIGHEGGALKRFKDQNERTLVKNFLELNR